MKGEQAVITLLGNNSGRNLGDAAILSSILESLSREIPGAKFLVPTIKPKWLETNYGKQYNVEAVDCMPWTLSLRLLGLPTIRCLAKSDVALICDGIIFGKKFFNPAFNYLITLVFLLPFARLFNCKIVCYSCGIGPFPGKSSKIAARWVINGSELVSMRDRDSKQLAQELGVTKEMAVTGDPAFINPVSSDARAAEIIKKEGIDPDKPMLGINITSYIDSWLAPNERVASKEEFLKMLSDGILETQRKFEGDDSFQVVLFSTQPMDEVLSRSFAEIVGAKLIHNSAYLSHDIQAVMRRCQLLMGMRFHSLVLASAVEVPVIGLIYAPKVRGYMRLIDTEEYGLELAQLNKELLVERLSSGWANRAQLKATQMKTVNELKEGAERAPGLLREKYFAGLEKSGDSYDFPTFCRG